MSRPFQDFLERFWSKVERSSGCWIWLSATFYGFGLFGNNGRMHPAHRIAYELCFKMPIPKHLVLDHLCRNPLCVNPLHLQIVTDRENVLRGNTIASRNANKSCCIKGHPFTPENTSFIVRTTDGRRSRRCLACHRIEQLARYTANRDEINKARREKWRKIHDVTETTQRGAR